MWTLRERWDEVEDGIRLLRYRHQHTQDGIRVSEVERLAERYSVPPVQVWTMWAASAAGEYPRPRGAASSRDDETPCEVPGCARRKFVQDLCQVHRRRWRKLDHPPLDDPRMTAPISGQDRLHDQVLCPICSQIEGLVAGLGMERALTELDVSRKNLRQHLYYHRHPMYKAIWRQDKGTE